MLPSLLGLFITCQFVDLVKLIMLQVDLGNGKAADIHPTLDGLYEAVGNVQSGQVFHKTDRILNRSLYIIKRSTGKSF